MKKKLIHSLMMMAMGFFLIMINNVQAGDTTTFEEFIEGNGTLVERYDNMSTEQQAAMEERWNSRQERYNSLSGDQKAAIDTARAERKTEIENMSDEDRSQMRSSGSSNRGGSRSGGRYRRQ